MTDEVLTSRAFTGRIGFFSSRIELLSDAIRFGGKYYPYSSVAHLGRYARRTSVNFIPMEDFLRVRIYVEGLENPITVQKNRIVFIFRTSNIEKIYSRLVEKTFQLRASSYLRQMGSKGFFEYGGAKFFPTGDVLTDNYKINLRTAKLWLKPFEFVLKEPAGFFARKRRISTDIDRDVFLALLKEIYGIKFGG